MKEEKDELMVEDEESINMDFGKYRRILKRHWKALMFWTIGGFAVGCLIALAMPRKYTCVSKLAPELSNTATSRLSSVASMIGFTSSVLGTTDAVYPMVYPDVVHSPEFVVDLFDMPVDFVYKKDSVHTTLYDYMENYYGKTPVGEVIGAPFRWIGDLMESFKDEEEASEDTFDPFCLTVKQGMVYKKLCKCIDADIDKKTLVVTVETSLDNRFVCAALSRAVNDNLKEYVTRYRTEKAVHDMEYYQKIYEETQQDYLASQDRYSRYVDSHQGVVLQRVNAEKERLKNEANLKYQLYTSTAQQLQQAEAKVQLETPVFAETVTPTTPFKSVNSRKKSALAFALVAFLIGVVVTLVKHKEE